MAIKSANQRKPASDQRAPRCRGPPGRPPPPRHAVLPRRELSYRRNVAACLSELTKEFDVAWDAIATAHAGDPKGQLLAWLRHVCDFKVNEAERGCGLANAAIELPDKDHPARRVIRV